MRPGEIQYLRPGEEPDHRPAPAVAFSLPWIPVSKKNEAKAIIVPQKGKGGTCSSCGQRRGVPKVVPSRRVIAEEEVVAGVARLTAAAPSDEDFLTAAAALRDRLKDGSRVGTKTLAKVLERTCGPTPAAVLVGRDVGLEVDVLVDEDAPGRVDVRVIDRGEAGPRARRRGAVLDVLNVPAIIADALQAIAFPDDADVVDCHVRIVRRRHEGGTKG